MNVSSNKTIFIIMVILLAVSIFFSIQYYSAYRGAYQYESELSINGKNYDFNAPNDTFMLPDDLEEISGLTFYRDNEIICVQDEDGKIFIYDLQKRQVSREEKFGKDDDYEGIEYVNDTVYVLTSKGEILYFPLYETGIGPVEKIDTPLSVDNDSEGLGYLPGNASLMIATKSSASIKGFKTDDNAIYFIEVAKKEFISNTSFLIKENKIEELLEEKGISTKKHLPARPSAVLSIDAPSPKVLILCSIGKLLLVYDNTGNLEDLVPLNSELFTQPEGLSCDDRVNIYISSEGGGKQGYILKFAPK